MWHGHLARVFAVSCRFFFFFFFFFSVFVPDFSERGRLAVST
jgi:hypothetical protein